MPKSPEQNQLFHNEGGNVEKERRLEILDEALEEIRKFLKRANFDSTAGKLHSSNVAYLLVEELGLDELGLDVLKIGISDFIEIMKSTDIKDKPSDTFPSNYLIFDNIGHQHNYAITPFWHLKNRHYKIPPELEVVVKEIQKLAVNGYILSNAFWNAVYAYREMDMPEKAAEMEEVAKKYPQTTNPEDIPDLHLCPPLKEVLAEFWDNIKDNPYVLTREDRIKLIENLERKVEAEIDKLKGTQS